MALTLHLAKFNGNETNTRARGGTQRKPSIIHDMARHIDFLTTT